MKRKKMTNSQYIHKVSLGLVTVALCRDPRTRQCTTIDGSLGLDRCDPIIGLKKN